ncbi:O-antigen ligase family protein [Streptomyces sp. NPDC059479]|uniref:O-antigen ligase family protein n=1 Tax=Streptomyces sp. NPDC059479 TaxID=3346848 RepID=UPI0036C1EC3D
MAAPAEPPVERSVVPERSGAPDVVGAVVLGACAVWALISAAGTDGRPEGVLLAVLAVTAGYASGRISGSLAPVATASVMAVAWLAAAIASGQEGFGTAVAVGTPPGDTGAVAGLLVLAAGAACCAATAAGPSSVRLTMTLLAVTIAGAALLFGSVAGFVAVLGVLLCSLATARTRRRVAGLAGLALVTALVVGASWAVAEQVLPEGLSVSLEGQLTQHRVALWQDAAELAKEHPLLGSGPDRFGDLSPTVTQSLDSDSTPHSAALQQAAEQGVVGVLLLGAVFGWLLYGLVRSACSTPVVLTAGAALTALAAVASVGNALSFTPVTAGAGLLAGLATARPEADAIPVSSITSAHTSTAPDKRERPHGYGPA